MDFRTCGMCFCAYSGCMLWEGGGAVVVEGPQVALQVLQTKVG